MDKMPQIVGISGKIGSGKKQPYQNIYTLQLICPKENIYTNVNLSLKMYDTLHQF